MRRYASKSASTLAKPLVFTLVPDQSLNDVLTDVRLRPADDVGDDPDQYIIGVERTVIRAPQSAIKSHEVV
jgi:hypothetical protein